MNLLYLYFENILYFIPNACTKMIYFVYFIFLDPRLNLDTYVTIEPVVNKEHGYYLLSSKSNNKHTGVILEEAWRV